MARPTRMDGELLETLFESSESADTDIFDDITPSYNPALIRVQATLASSAKLIVNMKDGSGTTHTSELNDGNTLPANAMQEFTFVVADPWKFNIQVGSAITVNDLVLWEDDGER